MNVPSGLKDSVLFHLDAAMRIILRRTEIFMQENFDLAVREGLIMMAANSDPPLSQGCMADILGVNRNVMVLEVDRLEARGYVKRERRRANRREQIITLTPKGRRTLTALEKVRSAKMRPRVWTSGAQRAYLLAWAKAIIEQNGTPPSKGTRHKTLQ